MGDNYVRVTFETREGHTNTIECDGIAGVGITKEKRGYENNILLVGKFSVPDLIYIHDTIEEQLLSLIKKEVVNDRLKHEGVSLRDLAEALARKEG